MAIQARSVSKRPDVTYRGQMWPIGAGFAHLGRICTFGPDFHIWAGFAHLGRIFFFWAEFGFLGQIWFFGPDLVFWAGFTFIGQVCLLESNLDLR